MMVRYLVAVLFRDIWHKYMYPIKIMQSAQMVYEQKYGLNLSKQNSTNVYIPPLSENISFSL
jgi:hypothetical protein